MSEGVVIVTGSAGGLGQVYCRELRAAGYTVVGADLAETSGAHLSVVTDVTDRQGTELLAAAALEQFGRIDALVNNAAYYSAIVKQPFEEIEDDEWTACRCERPWDMALHACCGAGDAAGRARGKIVNISSMTVPTAPPGFAHYVASKAAIVGLDALACSGNSARTASASTRSHRTTSRSIATTTTDRQIWAPAARRRSASFGREAARRRIMTARSSS